MTKTTLPQIHVIPDPDPDSVSAILIIEFQTNKSGKMPYISCFSRTKIGEITTHQGKIIGEGDCRLFVTRVSPSVIIKTRESAYAENPEFWRYFTIGTGFKLIQVASSRRELGIDEIPILPSTLPPDRSPNTMIKIIDNDLIKLFGDNQLPSSVRSILDFQLAYWNVHHIENYYRYMPGCPIGQEFERCIKAAPYWALARWKTKLFSHQRNYCMRRSPAGAVAFCIDNIPRVRRPWMLASNPDSALRHSFDRLDEKDLAVCVTAASAMAIAMAKGFPPSSRARLLGSVVKNCTRDVQYRPSALQSEIFDSIVDAPESWLADFDDSFVKIFEKMDHNLAIHVSGESLIALSKKLHPDKGARLLEVVTSWI